ncbi:nickel pincer cofactor biosynthesis protein LarB [Paractinoplanes ferrugineus]|uniref:1-(5-phosphoribosyl)-5-amino-4-imidazole-carboxyl ate carboxylase n=1 Tax=Paractinoplanes ferrugineus TaxID=113564 RepID=A0A919IXM0_9ACTN|nr:nickel pincer cofactor biosynthesis protein LarB [Actinoplanes ferrugineus]GIE10325.1 1-(5-phosphoribosyl)-5-amino-4-imidazole-carboxyl ate carboxylase [Actinoplanes ferrugineus]
MVTDQAELRLDPERFRRTGIAEAVYAPGKSPEQCAAAVAGLLAGGPAGPVLLTRAAPEQVEAARERNPGATETAAGLVWHALPPAPGTVLVLTAGTGDLPVAREAVAVLAAYGHDSTLVADVGVAGLHRVLAQRRRLAEADVVIVVAGMEGALASVAAGLTGAPVIAVPTSTGYGSGLEGVTALLAMTASCSPGVTVVGIDNGFGAGCAAVRTLRPLTGGPR